MSLAERLRPLVSFVDDDPATLAAHAEDSARIAAPLPAVRVRPASTAEVQAVLALAHAEGVPVVPQGARSGLVGGAAAIEGGILLDLMGLGRIVRIDPVDRSAVVQPGVIVAELQRAASARGLFYAPDPASADRASIGGTIATNAGGMRCIKYGVTRDAVRSLEVVLADGSVVRTRRETIKGVAGYDLTGLIVGSEGTLGVVTEATLSLLPAPGPSLGVAATFRTAAAAFEAANAIASGARRPSSLEYLDEVALRGIRLMRPELPLPTDAAAWLLAVTDDAFAGGDDLEAFAQAARAAGALEVRVAEDPAELEGLFTARRTLSPALVALYGAATHGDLSVPRHALPALAEAAAGIAARLGVEISLSGHVGDGNLHPTVVYDPADAEAVRASALAERALLEAAQALGGTVAGEHGVGTVKQWALDGEFSPRVRELQRAVKAVFDPRGILNPGRKL